MLLSGLKGADIERSRFFLVKSGLEIVGAVLVDHIVAVQGRQTDVLCYDEGKVHVSDGQRNVETIVEST